MQDTKSKTNLVIPMVQYNLIQMTGNLLQDKINNEHEIFNSVWEANLVLIC